MSMLSTLGRMFLGDLPAAPLQTRAALSEYPSFGEQMDAIRNRGRMTYRSASVNEALSVPAIFGAVSLIVNTVGSLSWEAFRRGVLMDMDDAPRLIQRPNPFTTLRDFLRDTAFHIATRGEAWWWVAVRDPRDNSPMSLYPVRPWEITVEQNDQDRLRPTIRWANRVVRNEDMRHITYLPGQDGRGVGPLQTCGAAVSVSVEAQEWAANFFSGAIPSIIGTTEQDMTPDELKELDRQWLEKPSNLPRWLTNNMKMSDSPFDPSKAQLTEAREFQVGDVARMFSIPGSLIEHSMSGSSLRYQNDETVWTDFQRRCLSPHYLEPMEQEVSDLLSRSTVARFNVKQLLRADAKTRMEVHTAAIAAGIYDSETAAREEGYASGNVDYAPVPQAPPQAVPRLLQAVLDDAHEQGILEEPANAAEAVQQGVTAARIDTVEGEQVLVERVDPTPRRRRSRKRKS
jgi:HK97 family phage portal protein